MINKDRYIQLRNNYINDEFSFLYAFYKESGGNLNPNNFVGSFINWTGLGNTTNIVKELDIKHEITTVIDLKNNRLIMAL